MVIEAQALHKTYDDVTALRGIDLQIAEGGIVGLLGPNGAGKTTLVEICEGLRTPTSGHVSVFGLSPEKDAARLKERVGSQLQSTAIPEDLTPIETLQLFASFYQNRASLEGILAKIHLQEKRKKRVGTLSGGQKQRLAIGIALVNDPDLIILDEPTTGLDPVARRQVHKIIKECRKLGKTVVLTTHYIEEAEQLCDRVIMIKKGAIAADGTPFELVGAANGLSTLWLAADDNFNPELLEKAGLSQQGKEGEHYKFATKQPAKAIIALGEILQKHKIELLDLRMKRPTLEDVYLEIMNRNEDEERADAEAGSDSDAEMRRSS